MSLSSGKSALVGIKITKYLADGSNREDVIKSFIGAVRATGHCQLLCRKGNRSRPSTIEDMFNPTTGLVLPLPVGRKAGDTADTSEAAKLRQELKEKEDEQLIKTVAKNKQLYAKAMDDDLTKQITDGIAIFLTSTDQPEPFEYTQVRFMAFHLLVEATPHHQHLVRGVIQGDIMGYMDAVFRVARPTKRSGFD